MRLLPGDVVLRRSRSGWLGKAIRWFTQRPDDPARFNHSEIITTAGDERTARVVGALWHVVGRPLWDAYGPPAGKGRPEILVYRIVGLTDEHTPICSLHVQFAAGLFVNWFNVPEGTADPDTLDDFRAPGVTFDLFGPGLLGAEIDGAVA